MKPLFVYITCKNDIEALQIGEQVVKEKLAACANILPKMKSVYFWEGELQIDEEAVLILKTHQGIFEQLSERVTKLHSYAVPAVLGLPIVEGSAAYIEWMADEMLV